MLENDLSLITSLIDKDITHNYEDGIGVVYNREIIMPNKVLKQVGHVKLK